MPAVTVVLPVHNRVPLLRRSVSSALTQNFRDLEIVVVDDGSSEDIDGALAEFDDPRLRLVRRPVRGGGSAARNTGIDAATGRYLAFLDSDDAWSPCKIQRQLPLVVGQVGLVLCGFAAVHPGRVRSGVPGALRGDARERLFGLCGGPLTTSLFLLPRAVADEGIRFDEALPALQDLDLALQVVQHGFAVAGVRQQLVRKFSDHEHGRVFTPANEIRARILLLEKYAEDLAGRPVARSRHHRALALALSDGGHRDLARAQLQQARAAHDSAGLRLQVAALAVGGSSLRRIDRMLSLYEDVDASLVGRRSAEVTCDLLRKLKGPRREPTTL